MFVCFQSRILQELKWSGFNSFARTFKWELNSAASNDYSSSSIVHLGAFTFTLARCTLWKCKPMQEKEVRGDNHLDCIAGMSWYYKDASENIFLFTQSKVFDHFHVWESQQSGSGVFNSEISGSFSVSDSAHFSATFFGFIEIIMIFHTWVMITFFSPPLCV